MKKKSASQSAFFKLRLLVGVLLCFGAITLLLFALGKASAQPRTVSSTPQVQRQNPYPDAWLAANHGKYDNIPSLYKNNLEGRPSGLWDQLQALSRCGFRDVDCFYKYSIFAVFGGTK